jgi:hypothetical protein
MALCGIRQLVRALLFRLRVGRRACSRRELGLLNLYADSLNEQGDESAAYQAVWYLE